MELKSRVELGRCNPSESMEGTDSRLIIAPPQQTTIPRRWFAIQSLGNNDVRITNIHSAHPVLIDSLGPIPPGGSCNLTIDSPVMITLSDEVSLTITTRAESRSSNDDYYGANAAIRSLIADRSVLASSNAAATPQDGTILSLRPLSGKRGGIDAASVVGLLEKALGVVTAAAGSDKFIEAAVRVAVEIVGLDRAVIIGRRSFREGQISFGSPVRQSKDPLCNSNSMGNDRDRALRSGLGPATGEFPSDIVEPEANSIENQPSSATQRAEFDHLEVTPSTSRLVAENWFPWVEHIAEHAKGTTPPNVSLSVLRRVDELHKTQICDATHNSATHTLYLQTSVVAAPILDRDGRLVAVLYGDRWALINSEQDEVSELEALLLDVLAGAVAGGLARQEEERSRAGLSEFFSPRVASLLVKRSDLLSGRDADVSVLFCDIRGFSAISEKFGAQRTIAWINDVLTELSQCVVDSDGVLVDYVGDELFAMWGAPEPQSDHARRAVTTALQMLVAVDRLRSRATEDFGCDLDVRIGINSGPARVGNVGSRLKFKYGVLGHTVNLGSRLQGACKYLGIRCLAAAAAVETLRDSIDTRRLASLRVLGIQEIVRVYECVSSADAAWLSLRDEYEAALVDFEAGRPGETVHRLGRLLQSHPNDRPSAILLSKAAKVLTDPHTALDVVWELDAK